jgi:hypothetical protein
MRRILLSTILGLLVVSAMATTPPRANAAQLTVTLSAESPVQAGQSSVLTATVADGGAPAVGISVTFYSSESFARVTGDAEIGRAITDASGVASFTFAPTETGTRNLGAAATAKDGTITKATTTLTIEGVFEQQYVQTAGIRVPGLNAWLIMALLSIVWGVLLFIAITVIRIAAAGNVEGQPDVAPIQTGGER